MNPTAAHLVFSKPIMTDEGREALPLGKGLLTTWVVDFNLGESSMSLAAPHQPTGTYLCPVLGHGQVQGAHRLATPAQRPRTAEQGMG